MQFIRRNKTTFLGLVLFMGWPFALLSPAILLTSESPTRPELFEAWMGLILTGLWLYGAFQFVRLVRR